LHRKKTKATAFRASRHTSEQKNKRGQNVSMPEDDAKSLPPLLLKAA
jgi:hypothetical protein